MVCRLIQPSVFLRWLKSIFSATGCPPRHFAAAQACVGSAALTGAYRLEGFLGLIHFYRRFLSGIAATLLPLTNALRSSPRHLTVTAEIIAAVAAAKNTLAAATGLAHPLPHAQLALVTDGPTVMLEVCCSSGREWHGGLSRFFHRSCCRHRVVTHLIESSLQCFLPFGIFVLCWREGSPT
jgi:hypothetical protein